MLFEGIVLNNSMLNSWRIQAKEALDLPRPVREDEVGDLAALLLQGRQQLTHLHRKIDLCTKRDTRFSPRFSVM